MDYYSTVWENAQENPYCGKANLPSKYPYQAKTPSEIGWCFACDYTTKKVAAGKQLKKLEFAKKMLPYISEANNPQ